MNNSRIQQAADGVRRRVLAHSIANNGGYMSQACSSAETLAFLYLEGMNLRPMERPLMPEPFPGVPSASNDRYFTGALFNGGHDPDHDRFYLSPAHYALPLYVALIEAGRMAEEGLTLFNQDGSSVEMIGAEHSPGMEVTTGSLGQGISQAAGSAMARKLKGERGIQWVYMSDGEFQIGQTWEAMQAISHHGLDNIRIVIDANAQQCDGCIEDVMNIEPLHGRLEAFGAVTQVVDGHDIDALRAAVNTPHAGRPLAVICRTDPCRGLERLRQNAPKLHYLRFKSAAEKAEYAAILDAWK